MSGFKKAERKKVRLKIAISGPSGSGKTLSALLLAKGLGGRIAVIDTENGSASLYAGNEKLPEYDTLELAPPFETNKYIDAIKTAEKEKYDVLIIDSASHQWSGEGGLLNKKEALDARGGNSYTNWAKLTPEHERFKSAILHSDLHVIMTVRSKQEYALVDDGKGKNKVQKLGMAPIQRDGMEYEFTTFFDLDMSHQAEASKDRTGMFDGKLFKINEGTGEVFKSWLDGFKGVAKSSDKQSTGNATNGIHQAVGGAVGERTKNRDMHSDSGVGNSIGAGKGREEKQDFDPDFDKEVKEESEVSDHEQIKKYVIPFGSFKDKRLSEIDRGELTKYRDKVSKNIDALSKQAPRVKLDEFVHYASAFLSEKKMSDYLDKDEMGGL